MYGLLELGEGIMMIVIMMDTNLQSIPFQFQVLMMKEFQLGMLNIVLQLLLLLIVMETKGIIKKFYNIHLQLFNNVYLFQVLEIRKFFQRQYLTVIKMQVIIR